MALDALRPGQRGWIAFEDFALLFGRENPAAGSANWVARVIEDVALFTTAHRVFVEAHYVERRVYFLKRSG